DAALMIESSGYRRVDKLIVVYCEPEIQLQRLMRRDGWSRETAEARIAAQMPQEEKKTFADFLINTSGDHSQTRVQVEDVYRKLLWNIARFDFGTSLKYEGQSVNQILWRGLPVSAALGITAYLIALIVGIAMGTFAALRQNSWIDYGSMALAMLGISIPNFVLGPLLVLLFSLTLFWFPPALWNGFASRSIILPALTLSAIYIAYIARLTRSGMLEVMR